jgi:hypothetical protein
VNVIKDTPFDSVVFLFTLMRMKVLRMLGGIVAGYTWYFFCGGTHAGTAGSAEARPVGEGAVFSANEY